MMTDEQKYNELLKEVANSIKQKNDLIKFQEYKIADLQAKLEAAESKIAQLTTKGA